MCDPLTMIGAAASLAGNLANASAQQSYVNETNKQNNKAYEMSRQARLAEQARQKQFEDQSLNNWRGTLSKVDQPAQQQAQDASQQDFMQRFDNKGALNEGMLEGQQGASAEVSKAVAGKLASSAADARNRVAALAKLSSYGAANQNNQLALTNNADFLSMVNGLRRGSLNVSQQEQSIQPATVNKPSTAFGDILSGLGGLALYQGGINTG